MAQTKSNIDLSDSQQLPILPLRDTVLFPHVPTRLLVSREGYIDLVKQALGKTQIIAVVTQRDVDQENPRPDEIY